jgi:acetyl esterase/lipase
MALRHLKLGGSTAALLAAFACGQPEQSISHRSGQPTNNGSGDLRPKGDTVETPLVTVKITANAAEGKVYAPPGSTVEVEWSSVGAAFCVAPLGEITLHGKKTSDAITDTIDYMITCTGAQGTATASVKVIPGDPPPEANPSASPNPAARYEIVRTNNVNYGTGGGTALVTDVAYPKDATGPFPGLVMIHGGEWTSGSRKTFTDLVDDAAARGYVAISIDYRLVGTLFPGQVEDVKCAIRWLRAHAADYKLDKSKIGLVGISAGAHLGMIAAYSDATQFQGTGGSAGESSAVQAVVNWSGPTDLASLYTALPALKQGAMATMLGGTPTTAAAAYAAASPLTYVNAGDPPTWSTHGKVDTLVPSTQATALETAAKAAGVVHSLALVEGQGHVFDDAAARDAAAKAFTFLDAQLK